MPSFNRVAVSLLVPAALATALAGCLPLGDADERVATASAASALQSSRNAGNANGLTKGIQTGLEGSSCASPEGVAKACAAEPNVGIYPQGCAVKTSEGDSLHVEYNDCTGPSARST